MLHDDGKHQIRTLHLVLSPYDSRTRESFSSTKSDATLNASTYYLQADARYSAHTAQYTEYTPHEIGNSLVEFCKQQFSQQSDFARATFISILWLAKRVLFHFEA